MNSRPNEKRRAWILAPTKWDEPEFQPQQKEKIRTEFHGKGANKYFVEKVIFKKKNFFGKYLIVWALLKKAP